MQVSAEKRSPYLSNYYNVGVLLDHVLEAFLKGQVYFGVYRALSYPVDKVLNRVLERL